MPIKTISAAQFATAFDLRPNLVAWFLGAGASAASGIPTGYAIIRDFKAQIFCRETNLSKREIDTADPIWIDRIDAFFRQTSLLPPDGDPAEYAKAFEAVYPEARHRRQYIDDAISKGTPCFGHKVLGSLMAAGKVDSVFTTNFDPLIEESVHSANMILPVTDLPKPLFDRVMEGRPTPRLVPVQLPTTEARSFPVLRYSSLLVESMPCTARRVKLAQNTTSPIVRDMLKEKGVRATVAANGRELAVFGKNQDILDALAPLGAMLDGEIKLDPAADSWAMGLIYDALVRSLARRLPLIPRYKRSGHSLIIASPRDGEGREQARRNAQMLSNARMRTNAL